MKIKLLKKFYSVFDISEMTDTLITTVRERIRILEIEPDILINDVRYYSEESKNKIIGLYEFEKSFSEILYHERNKPKEKFEVFESKINFKTI